MKLHSDITLPASKSESNRALMIAAYGSFTPDFQNLSDSNDTLVLAKALNDIQQGNSTVDIADCGTAARFLTTYLACHEGDWLLTGTERMQQRPIASLVEALNSLGAEIQYISNERCLPLRIKGKSLAGGKVRIDMHSSSQFASSLVLAAPMLPKGIEIELLGEFVSVPYLDMTVGMMRHFGAEVEQKGRIVKVFSKPYQSKSFRIDADWSAASYWYEMAALSEECEIRLRGLTKQSLQGDSIIAEWMQQLGVGTFIENDSAVLKKIPFDKRPMCFDFSNCPDLYPTMVATCAALHIEAHFTGIGNLHLKESNRVEAMQTELAKLGQQPLRFCSHGDHRIVMALAPLALLYGPVTFDHPDVVKKSYPRFWYDADFLSVN
jgi:3-phosphoshikimate 1-carboxyvinyltransferase